MKVIWKFDLNLEGQVSLTMPAGAKILCVQMQGAKPQLWAEVNVTHGPEWRDIAIYKTGDAIPDEPGQYIGTFQYEREPGWGVHVGHVYDRTPK